MTRNIYLQPIHTLALQQWLDPPRYFEYLLQIYNHNCSLIMWQSLSLNYYHWVIKLQAFLVRTALMWFPKFSVAFSHFSALFSPQVLVPSHLTTNTFFSFWLMISIFLSMKDCLIIVEVKKASILQSSCSELKAYLTLCILPDSWF